MRLGHVLAPVIVLACACETKHTSPESNGTGAPTSKNDVASLIAEFAGSVQRESRATSPAAPEPRSHWARLRAAADVKLGEARCRATTAEIVARLTKTNPQGPRGWAGLIEAFVAAPPAGIDASDARACASAFAAQLDDNDYMEVASSLRTSAHMAFEKRKSACPSAPPLPKDIGVLAKGKYVPAPSELEEAGWACLGGASEFEAPLVAQREVRRIDDTSWEAIVRRPGPAPGDTPSEYIARGGKDGGGLVTVR